VRPEVLERLRDLLPLTKGPAPGYGPAYDAWVTKFNLPTTSDMAIETFHTTERLASLVEPRWRCELSFRQEAIFEHDFAYPFLFEMEGWRPRMETIEQAESRINRGFQDQLRLSIDAWQRERQEKALDEALTDTEREGLRLLALRQAHGLTYRDLAEGARRFRERTVGIDWSAEEITEATARHRVKAAAALIGVVPRKRP
ncbi:MAG TPA: hypothetical protein VKU44_03185, partial [Terriglobia bacterium]|nr:hypothetical protein [Terriglobia bacterium]